MKKIRIRHLILTQLVFVQCTVDDEDTGDIEFVQENLKNEVLFLTIPLLIIPIRKLRLPLNIKKC